MRADRLVATLLLMQARGLVTAAELAEELEISVATARRDLEALSAAGIPVYPQRGRGGGWALLGGARTDLSGLSFPEMQALFLLIGPAAAVSPDAKAALRKLVRALPESFRAQAEAASTAVVVDASRWGDRPTVPAELLETLRTAVVGRDTLLVGYRDDAAARARPLGPRRQGRHLVPHRRDAARAPHLPGRPDDIGRAERSGLRGARRFRSRRGVGEITDRARGPPLRHLGRGDDPRGAGHPAERCARRPPRRAHRRRRPTAARASGSPRTPPACSPASSPAGRPRSTCSARRRCAAALAAIGADLAGRFGAPVA